MLPGENVQAVLLLPELLLDVGPHAFGLALQQDEDDWMPTQLHQVKEALSVQARTQTQTHAKLNTLRHTLTPCGGT